MATTLERPNKAADIRKPGIPPRFLIGHIIGLVLFGIAIVGLGVTNAWSLMQKQDEAASEAVELPSNYDYSLWRDLVVQHNARLKPFETAAQEVCREIHGRNKVLGHDSVPVVVSWLLEGSPKSVDRYSRWDDKRFILCEHQDVRRFIFLLNKDGTLKENKLTEEQIHGRYMSPRQLKEFVNTFVELKKTKQGVLTKLTENLPTNELFQVEARLNLYEALRHPKAAEGQYLEKGMGTRDPFALVILDKVPGSPWFSMGQLWLMAQADGDQVWHRLMKDRVKDVPQLYLSEEHKAALAAFQQKLVAGQGSEAIAPLKDALKGQREKVVDEYLDLRKAKKTQQAQDLLAKSLFSWTNFDGAANKKALLATAETLNAAREDKNYNADEAADALRDYLAARDQWRLQTLEKQLPQKGDRYQPNNPEFRFLHITYLETRFPGLYQEITQWQAAPLDSVRQVLTQFDALCAAYDSGDAAKFSQASQAYFGAIKQTSEQEGATVYPGTDTVLTRLGHLVSGQNIDAPSPDLISLELLFNRVKPFMWAWVLMLGSLLFFCLSLGLNSRICYIGGFAAYAASLALQIFGFFTRIVVSGRPPVSNMYETVIWVAFMTGIFALVLESIYRRRVIAIAGAFVATLGLVLADQLPLALDPKITSLVPVLRSNFWLTIHVLTIVSSYAAGALAWALGNIALVLIVFGHTNRDTVKMLSNFTYRALQIAVLLLAAGTFLGGWWAAYSWGRFWGWDPKETGALIALLVYVIPLHMRYIGWIRDFGTAVAGIVCFAAIMVSWYGVNFVFPAGLHAYGFGAGGAGWVYLAASINLEWVLAASLLYRHKQLQLQVPARTSVLPA